MLTAVPDFDPEDDSFRPVDEEDSEADEEDADNDAGREHYESVGKSRLRKPEQPALGAKYGGVAVSRKDLEEEDEDDPFAPVEESEEDDPFAARNGDIDGSDEETGVPDDVDIEGQIDENDSIDSDEAFGEGDEERFKKFKFGSSKKNRVDGPSEHEISDEESEDNETDVSKENATEDTDLDMDEEQEDDEGDDEDEDDEDDDEEDDIESAAHKPSRNAEREELKKAALSSSTAGLASALSAGANADVQKGKAVKQQRQTFDRLLDARIKLQKGITAMNDISGITISDDEIKHAAQQAEDAALALWSTIDTIRRTILSASKTDSEDKGTKRPFTPSRSTPITEIWAQTTSLDANIYPVRRATLDKWHAKTQPVIDTAPRSKLLKPSAQSSSTRSRLTDVLDTYLATESNKLVAAASSVPAPAASSSSFVTFDDAPFYQSLLRDLIASRNADSAGATAEPLLPPKLHPSGSKNQKVDTKASKGRKVRYTVHEKLENFMAPEDRSTWEDAARSEFFASLFGNAAVLNEGVGNDDEDGEEIQDEMADAEGEALRLFRS